MRKLTAISLSLMLCPLLYAQDNGKARKIGEYHPVENSQNHRAFHVKDPGALDLSISTGDSSDPQKRSSKPLLLSDSSPIDEPEKANVVTENLFGAFTYPTSYCAYYRINVATGALTKAASYRLSTIKPQVMGIVDNIIYAIDWTVTTSGQPTGAWLTITDMDSGERETIDIGDYFSETPQGGAFVAPEMAFYGYSGQGWSKMDATTGECTLVASDADGTMPYTKTLAYNPVNGKIYGMVSYGKQLVEVNKANGSWTVLKETEADLYTGYQGGFCYDADSNNFIFNKVKASGYPQASYMMAINAETFNVKEICKLRSVIQTTSMYCTETTPSDPEAPVAPEFISASFPNGALFGQITFKLPTSINDDDFTTITGNVDYTVKAGDIIVARGSGPAGSTVTSNVQLSEGGNIPFYFNASIGTHVSKTAKEFIYIGNDVPLAPTGVKLNVQTVTWNPVSRGVHNGFLDLSKLTYTVKINGELVADGITGTCCATNLPLTAELSNYVAEVYAVCSGMVSTAGSSNNLIFGQPFNVPVSIFPSEDQVSLFKIVDNNADRTTWLYSADDKAFRYSSLIRGGDDFLIMPPVKVNDHNHLYDFYVDAWSRSTSTSESVELYVGHSADVETMTKISDEISVTHTSSDRQTLHAIFEAPEGDQMYLAVKATSTRGNWYLFVNNFRVEKSNVAIAGPAAVTDVEATAGKNGALEATVSFKIPTTTFAGTPLNGNITVEIENLVDYKKITGAPGSTHTVKLAAMQSTTTDIDPIVITPYAGDEPGMPVKINLWVGVEVPAMPENVVISPNKTNFGGTLSWSKVTVGNNGGYIDPSGVAYYLVQRIPSIIGYMWQISGLIGYDVDHFDFTISDGAPLATYGLSVISENVAGRNTYLYGALCNLGTPYQIPVVETYSGGDPEYGFIIYGNIQEDQEMDVDYKEPAKLGAEYAGAPNQYAMICTLKETGEGYIDLAPFSTKDATKVAFIPNVFIGSCENIRVSATAYGIEETEIFNLSTLVNVDLSGYQDLTLELPETFQNKEWVNFRIYGEFSAEKPYLIIGGYSIRNLVPYDVAASGIEAPDKVVTGLDYDVEVTVSNKGLQKISEYTVELYEDGELVETKTGQSLDPESMATVTFKRNMSAIATASLEYYAKVSCPNDATDLNSTTAIITVEPKQSQLPGPSELQANDAEGNSVILTWLEPDLNNVLPDPVTEDFEDAEAFAGEYGQWIFIDRDDSPVGGFQNLNIPGLTPGTTTGSFWIWDQSQLGNSTFEAHSGSKYLFSLYRYDDGEVDDWAISPELAGCAQTISFWAKSYNETYAENIRVLYSNGSVEPDDFIELTIDNAGTVPGEWTKYEVELPEGATRFAINSCAASSFMLMVDDVTFIPAGDPGDAELIGYDVYRNGLKINSSMVSENDYADSDVIKDQTYSYIVVAVFDKGTSRPSNVATIKVGSGIIDVNADKTIATGKGFIRITGYDGEKVVITTVDGKVVASGNASEINTVAVPAGVYVVNAGKKVAKVIVK